MNLLHSLDSTEPGSMRMVEMLKGRHSISRTSVRTRTAAFELSYIPAQGNGL